MSRRLVGPLLTFLSCGVASTALVLTLFAPQITDAGSGRSRRGAKQHGIHISGSLVPDSELPHGWAVELTAENPTEHDVPCTVLARLTKTIDQPFARVEARSIRLGEIPVVLVVPAKERVVRRLEVPEELAKQLITPKKRKARKSLDLEAPTISFGVAFKVTPPPAMDAKALAQAAPSAAAQ